MSLVEKEVLNLIKNYVGKWSDNYAENIKA